MSVVARPESPEHIVIAPDGTVYFSETRAGRIRVLGPDGVLRIVAGDPSSQSRQDGILARNARLIEPTSLALGPDQSLYFVELGGGHPRVRKIGTNGVLSTVAGAGFGDTETHGLEGLGGPASQSRLYAPTAVAIGPDGSVYVADAQHMIARVTPDGIFERVIGTGQWGFIPDTANASEAAIENQRTIPSNTIPVTGQKK